MCAINSHQDYTASETRARACVCRSANPDSFPIKLAKTPLCSVRVIGKDFDAKAVPPRSALPCRLWRNNFYSGKLRTEFPVWWTQFMGTFSVYNFSIFDPWIRSWENFLNSVAVYEREANRKQSVAIKSRRKFDCGLRRRFGQFEPGRVH